MSLGDGGGGNKGGPAMSGGGANVGIGEVT